MMRMIRCESDKEYEELWKEYNKQILDEPFLPSKYKVKVQQEYSMTPELMVVIHAKDQGVEAIAEALEGENADEKTALIEK